MVTETNAEQVRAGEGSSSRRKRQRLPSIVEDEAEPVEAEIGENIVEGTATGNQNIDGDEVIITEVITEVRSGKLIDLELLDCPVCCHPLTNPIFQCDNGHIGCSACCIKLRNKCPSCTLPIGNYRCRIMERVVEATIVPCPNSKHGCTEKFSYGKELIHAKVCSFVLCYCPAPDCNYTGVDKDLYRHYHANHLDARESFTCGVTNDAWLHITDKILVLQQRRDTPLVVVQCFEEPQGLYVTMNCIAPCAQGVAEFSYHLSYSSGGKTMSFGLDEMNRIQKVSFQTPEKDFMCVPHNFLDQRANLKMKICISRRGKEQEEKEAEAVEEHAETEVVDNVRRSSRERKANSKYQDKVK